MPSSWLHHGPSAVASLGMESAYTGPPKVGRRRLSSLFSSLNAGATAFSLKQPRLLSKESGDNEADALPHLSRALRTAHV